MRTAYGAKLDELTGILCALAREAGSALDDASAGLLGPDVHRAENVIARIDYITELAARCENHAISLLALQAPVAVDLRRVFSAMRMSGDLARMGGLAVHVAESVRRRHPEAILPPELVGPFTEIATHSRAVVDRLHAALETTNVVPIENLHVLVERVDRLQDEALAFITAHTRVENVISAVDVALLCRFYQRFAFQGMDVANRVMFLVDGEMPPVVP